MSSRRDRPLRAAAAKEAKRRRRIGRDSVVVAFALGMSAVEISLLGARPHVLTFLAGVLLSPLVIRVDEARREGDT